MFACVLAATTGKTRFIKASKIPNSAQFKFCSTILLPLLPVIYHNFFSLTTTSNQQSKLPFLTMKFRILLGTAPLGLRFQFKVPANYIV